MASGRTRQVWRPFQAARRYARALGLHNRKQWRAHLSAGPRKIPPRDLPRRPDRAYLDEGWKGWRDFLGHGHSRDFRSYDAARRYARTLGLRSGVAWRQWRRDGGRLPADLPKAPDEFYRDEGWRGWDDFLGTGKKPRGTPWRSFRQARAFARSLKLRSQTEWTAYCAGRMPRKPARPIDVPATPSSAYGDRWTWWGDWLGNGRRPLYLEHRSYADARAFVHRLRLRSAKEWHAYCRGELPGKPRLPSDIPRAPNVVYAEWAGYRDWLDNNWHMSRGRKTFRSFRAARRFVRKLGLKSMHDWRRAVRGEMRVQLPPDIPRGPKKVYAGRGWSGWRDWLGTSSRTAHRRRTKRATPHGNRSPSRERGLKAAANSPPSGSQGTRRRRPASKHR